MLRSCRLSSKFMTPISSLLRRNYASVTASPVALTKSKAGVTVVSFEGELTHSLHMKKPFLVIF
jgi:hypothetical protein